MTEDAKVLEDGPALEPTNRLRGLAAVEDVVAVAGVGDMSENGKDVSNRGKFYAPADRRQLEGHVWMIYRERSQTTYEHNKPEGRNILALCGDFRQK